MPPKVTTKALVSGGLDRRWLRKVVTTSASGVCTTSMAETLVVEAGDTVTRYVADYSSGCQPLPEGVFVKNIYVMGIMQDLAHPR